MHVSESAQRVALFHSLMPRLVLTKCGQSICSDVRSVIRASVEDLFAMDVMMFDPRWSESLHGHREIMTALTGVSRLFEQRSYTV